MVADDKVNTQRLCIGYLLDGLDTTVQHDNQFHTRLGGIVQRFLADAIALLVAVGYVILDV